MQTSLFVFAALGTLASLSWAGCRWAGKKSSNPTILLGADASGLLIRELTPRDHHTRVVPWQGIHAVAAYKLDQFSLDTIALGFHWRTARNWNLMKGWKAWRTWPRVCTTICLDAFLFMNGSSQ